VSKTDWMQEILILQQTCRGLQAQMEFVVKELGNLIDRVDEYGKDRTHLIWSIEEVRNQAVEAQRTADRNAIHRIA
jgi:hypothetical protein